MTIEQKIAVLLTCHNRREKTLRCLARLHDQIGLDNVEIVVFLVDDGSSDGTAEAVRSAFPSVRIILGDGSLYWTGGMRLAMEWAQNEVFDFYLWLNDDTDLYSDALQRLLRTYHELLAQGEHFPIVAGNLRDPVTKKWTYGGSRRISRWQPLRFSRVLPQKNPQRCDVFNANCVLLPRAAVELVGNLHPRLVHAAGDYEYGLRANRRGVRTWIAADYIAECGRNSTAGTWVDTSLPLSVRYRKLMSIKGQPPIPRLIYYSGYGGILWPINYALVYIRPILSSISRALRRN